ncbi:signal transduction histidine kinase [Saccharothrix carnea]|uniref:histidine kinase n=1 Tax=Saccharothrix carnea TaxID=1280637 RepID=A0A2P8I1X5_SACCR|nr:histidine kinase [Saccharothrix carnea]PSL52458.1 signal transduction histidine kinase [Saccharothrix carnea]
MVIFLEFLAVVVPAAMVLLADHVPYAWSIPTALAACVLLPVRRWRPSIAALLCLPGLVGGLGWPPTVVALYRVGRKSTVPVMIAWVGLATALPSTLVVVSQGLAPGAALLTFAFSLFMAGAPTALGALITTRRELTASLAEASRARTAEVEAREDGARAAERARIAREIHDAVGHHATLIAVESAALAATTEDAKTRDTALRLRALAKEALAEMRAALGLLNTEPTPGFEGLPSLVDRARSAGLTVHYEDRSGTPPPPATGRAAYRVVQEALTNATKHAPNSTVHVRLSKQDENLRVTIVNDRPTTTPPPPDQGGHGLHGLRERVAQAGGTLTTTAHPDGGFTVDATLPTGPSKVDTDDSTFGGSARNRANA